MIGENFPYTNFHDMNLDWMIKIAKDFLDQYTSLQTMISEGEASLEGLTTDGLQQLQDKADALEAALQAWYTEHSEDIANELADALDDISGALTAAVSSFGTQAEQKGEQVLQSIPDDYTEITEQINNVENLLILSNYNARYALDDSFYTITDEILSESGTGTTANTGYITTPYIPIYSAYERFSGNAFPLAAFNSFVLYSADYTVLYRAHGSFSVNIQDYPTAKYFRASQNTLTHDLTVYIDNNQYQYVVDMMEIFTDGKELPNSLLVNENQLMKSAGGVETMSGYYLSDYIPIFSKNIHFYGNFFPAAYYTTFVLYDEDLTALYVAHGTEHINIDSYPTAKYFRYGSELNTLHTYIGVGKENIQFEIGTGKFYTTLRDGIANAIKFNNSKVIVYSGTYDLTQEFSAELANETARGIQLLNGIHVIFESGAYVTALFPSSSSYISQYFQPFYGYNFTLENLNIKSSNCRYCVHDEQASEDYFYHNRYINCMMNHESHAAAGAGGYPQCIGGGLGKHGYIEVIGGLYKSEGDTDDCPAISYHNGSANGCDSRIFIKDLYLGNNNRLQFASWGTQDAVTQIFVCNCSMGQAIEETVVVPGGQDNIWITAWNNTVR